MFRKIIDMFKTASEPDAEREVVYVSGSHGELVVDFETGFVLEYFNSSGLLFEPPKKPKREDLEENWAYYSISRFDLAVYPREVKPGDHFDILELGYIYRDLGSEAKYEWPEPDAGLTAILSSVLNGYASGTVTELSDIVSDFRDLLCRCSDYTGELSPPTQTGDHADKFGGKSPWRDE